MSDLPSEFIKEAREADLGYCWRGFVNWLCNEKGIHVFTYTHCSESDLADLKEYLQNRYFEEYLDDLEVSKKAERSKFVC